MKIWQKILIVTSVISIYSLVIQNMATNEQELLSLARQYVDPTWIPNDWYLNQPPGYRQLFQATFGHLIVWWGFLTASIVGRLFIYFLFASGLVLISCQIGLSLIGLLFSWALVYPIFTYRSWLSQYLVTSEKRLIGIIFVLSLLLIALFFAYKRNNTKIQIPLLIVGLILYLLGVNRPWSIGASEYMVGSLEAKGVAYGLIILGLGFYLSKRYLITAFLVGLGTSFHVLVGSYTFLVILLHFILNKNTVRFKSLKFAWILTIFLTSSIFAFPPILKQLFNSFSAEKEDFTSSFLYVFIRLPHHLNPFNWEKNWYINLIIYPVILAISIIVIKMNQRGQEKSENYQAQMDLLQLTLLSMIPFLFGLAIAPFDKEGKILQYYPFRLGDVMLPFSASLLFTSAIEGTFTSTKNKLRLKIFYLIALIPLSTLALLSFYEQLQGLRDFPNKQQGVSTQEKEILYWIKQNIPKDDTVISPPQDLASFSWLTERPTIVKYKFFPQEKNIILEWYQRLDDLSGQKFKKLILQKNQQKYFNTFANIANKLDDNYYSLSTEQVISLMQKYKANYFLTRTNHILKLPIIFRNSSFVIYRSPISSVKQKSL